jgi:hypothetical protein
LPEHRVLPGTQVPVQLPVTHANMHVASLPHKPFAPQVCEMFEVGPVQRLVVGGHSPVQAPAPVHTFGHGVPVSDQLPAASQT